ncbi:MAG: MoaD/ThiS family protein [Gammaproteobacteria bacterium]|nr:MoaD/ThiS family protein [Gammaproteobacteria bacterium]MDD9800833.1 MoaD/ThiS family protein [Gammaproteobacteria bacterium]
MKITVKASGILGEHFPGGPMTVPQKTLSVAALLSQLPLPPDLPCMVSVNNALVPKAMHREKMLNDGDEVVVMPPLKGG